MANQCEQLLRLLRLEAVDVCLVRTNAPYRPRLVERLPVLRAVFRLLPYLVDLWRSLGRVDVVHVFANSGLAWYLLAWPALVLARRRGVATIVNYRGGNADPFFADAPNHVNASLARATLRVTPSGFLQRVFAKHGLSAEIIPNVIDLSRFGLRAPRPAAAAAHLIVTRNLEAIYDIATALQAFALLRKTLVDARLTVAGSGPQGAELQALAANLGVAEAVRFSGRIDNADIAALYASADCMLNPSTVDNMPISILEALACGVPVVSTDAGGIPDMVVHEQTALLVPIGDAAAMAAAALRVLNDPSLATRLAQAGRAEVERYSWARVMQLWRDAYTRAAASRGAT